MMYNMAYFPNGTEGMDYEAQYCDKCIHQDPCCPIWNAHMLYNYRDCDDDDSILHLLIPRSKDGLSNEQCRMFTPKE